MEYRPLGKTGAQISAIGLGTEYLFRQPRETVVSVVQEAVEQGVNFLDILFTVSEYLENLRAGLEGRRDRVLLAAHLGSGEKDGQTASVWEKGECLRFFDKTLSGLGADYADIVFIHMVDNEQLLTRWLPEMLEAAERLRAQGKVRWIGMTSHKAEIALRAVNDGRIEVLLFPINLAGHSIPGKESLFQACMQQGVGLVAMKPYAGGLLLAPFHSGLYALVSGGWRVCGDAQARAAHTGTVSQPCARPDGRGVGDPRRVQPGAVARRVGVSVGQRAGAGLARAGGRVQRVCAGRVPVLQPLPALPRADRHRPGAPAGGPGARGRDGGAAGGVPGARRQGLGVPDVWSVHVALPVQSAHH